MQFASPKGLLNFLTGGNSSIFATNEGKHTNIQPHMGFASPLVIKESTLKSRSSITDEPSQL